MTGAELFSQQSKRWAEYEERGGPAVAAAVDSAKLLAASGTLSEAERRAAIAEVQQTVHRLLRLDAVAAARRDAFRRLADAVRGSGGEELDVRALYDDEMRRAEQVAARVRVEHSKDAKAVAELLRAGGDGDDDVEVAEGETSARVWKCPILSTPMENPMKNAACSHVYGYQGALLLLNQRHQKNYATLEAVPRDLTAPCPVAGCKCMFNAGSLTRDYAAERSQRIRTATRTEDDDDEELNMVNG